MNDDEHVSRKATLPKFGGAHKDFQTWWTRFLAFAAVYQFTQVLTGTPETDLPSSDAAVIDTSTDPGKRQKLAKDRNNIAMEHFTMPFTSAQTLGLIYKAQDASWPAGLAHKVVTALKSKYKPVDMVSLVEMRQAMAKVSMKKNEEPSSLFEKICEMENRFSRSQITITDEEKIATVLAAAPNEYIPLLTAEQRAQQSNLTLDHLQDAMMTRWRQIHNDVGQDDGNEVTLSAFDGICL
jgi:hypothetical protein